MPPEKEPKTIEKQEKGPRTSFRFLFVSHNTEEDAMKLEPRLKGADIFAVEMIGLDEEDRKNFAKLLEGEINADGVVDVIKNKRGRFVGEFFFRYLINMLGEYKKPLILADIPAEDAENQNKYKFLQPWTEADALFQNGQLDKSLKKLEEAARILAEESVKKREKFIIPNFKKQLKNLIESNPDLRGKKEIKVTLIFGAGHTTLFQEFRKEFPDTQITREFENMPFIFSSFDEIVRRFVFGKKIDKDMLARSLIESKIFQIISEEIGTKDTQRTETFSRKLASRLSYSSARRISQNLGTGMSFRQALVEEGVLIPANRERYEQILKNEQISS